MNELLDNVTLDELSGESRELAEAIGLEAFKKLVRVYGGSGTLCIPTAGRLTTAHRNAQIRNEYSAGKSILALSQKWGLTGRYIHVIIHGR